MGYYLTVRSKSINEKSNGYKVEEYRELQENRFGVKVCTDGFTGGRN